MPQDAVWPCLVGQYSWNPQRKNPRTHCSECASRHFHSSGFVRGENLSRLHKQRHVGARSTHAAVHIDTKVREGQPTVWVANALTHLWAEVYWKNKSLTIFCNFIFKKKPNQTKEISHQIIKRLLDNNFNSHSGILVIPSPPGIRCIALWRVLRVPAHQWKVVKLHKNLCSVA